MKTTKRFPVRGLAACTLDIYSDVDWSGADGLGDPGIPAAVEAWRAGGRKALVVDQANLSAVLDGLNDLSNTEDEAYERERKKPPAKRDTEYVRCKRAASQGLSTVAMKIGRAFRTPSVSA